MSVRKGAFDVEAEAIARIIESKDNVIYTLRGDRYIRFQYVCKNTSTFMCMKDEDLKTELTELVRLKCNVVFNNMYILPEYVLCNSTNAYNFCVLNIKCCCFPLLCCLLPSFIMLWVKSRYMRLNIMVFFENHNLLDK
jgi:hypothetical protein